MWIAHKTYLASPAIWDNYFAYQIKQYKIHKNDIGTSFYANLSFFSPYVLFYNSYCFDLPKVVSDPSLNRYFGLAAFEYDWYASKKKLMNLALGSGGSQDYWGRRKFHSEWYYWKPEDNLGYQFHTRNPDLNSEYTNTTNGKIVLKRVNS